MSLPCGSRYVLFLHNDRIQYGRSAPGAQNVHSTPNADYDHLSLEPPRKHKSSDLGRTTAMEILTVDELAALLVQATGVYDVRNAHT